MVRIIILTIFSISLCHHLKNKIMNMKLQVTEYLKTQNNGMTPTQIGLALGKIYNNASSSVNNPLKQLVSEGLVLREKIDGKVLYKWNRNK